jgi:hypothetical protein
MIKTYGFYKNIGADYEQILQKLVWNFSDHCMWPRDTYKKDLDGEIAPFYDTGYYTQDNTQLWQTRLEETQIDAKFATDNITLIDPTVTFIKLDPGRTLPWHRDAFFLLKNKQPTWQEQNLTPIRHVIFLQDWQQGQFVQIEEQVITQWRAGDCWYFCHRTYHMGCNGGLVPFVTMQVSGFQNKTP